ncbi:MAG TPA: hypothetical protein DCW39_03065, partial [Betaproteobacteria bacterium]|nr:hypothetical protein [Betaproteobacteria bacterium]
ISLRNARLCLGVASRTRTQTAIPAQKFTWLQFPLSSLDDPATRQKRKLPTGQNTRTPNYTVSVEKFKYFYKKNKGPNS